jgi:hypothetical protein
MLDRVEGSDPGDADPWPGRPPGDGDASPYPQPPCPGARRAARVPARGLAVTLFALLIAGRAALVAAGAAGAGSADGARTAGRADRVGPRLAAMTTQQALRAVLGSGAAPSSAGAASAAEAVPVAVAVAVAPRS